MKNLIAEILEAHGGTSRWNELSKVDVSIRSGGKLFELQGMPQDANTRKMEIFLHEQKLSLTPYGGPDRKTNFTSDRIAIETLDGEILSERTGSVEYLHNHMQGKEWDPLDRAYFNGYANWTYLATPFFLGMPGIQSAEITPWVEGTEHWRGVRVTFPKNLATHSAIQDFYFGDDYLLRRHDYLIDVAGHFYAAQYVENYTAANGILLPTKRRAYKRSDTGHPIKDELMVFIDYSDIRYS